MTATPFGSALPSNIEAEQAFLGALLLNNEVLTIVPGLAPEHFWEPVHGRIFELACRMIAAGRLVSPVTIKAHLAEDEGLKQLGGTEYLARIAGATISIASAPDHAAAIIDLATRRELMRTAEEAWAQASLMEDMATVSETLEQGVMLARDAGTDRKSSVTLGHALGAAMQRMIDAREAGPATPTGIASLDRVIGGLFAGDMVLIGGRPSMGKTALAQSIARRIARRGRAVIFASLEMQSPDLAIRVVSEALRERGTELRYQDMRRGAIGDDEARQALEASVEMEGLPFDLVESHVRSVAQIAAEFGRIVRRRRDAGLEVGAGFIDYLGMMHAPGDRYQSDNSRVSAISAAIKSMAAELNIPIVALSQLSRGVESREDRRPQMSDLRDSGSLEQDADVIMFAYREEYYLQRRQPDASDAHYADWLESMQRARGRMEVIVAKQRMGPVGTVDLACDLATNSIWDLPDGGDRIW